MSHELLNSAGETANPCLTHCEQSSCCRDIFFSFLKKNQLDLLTQKGTNTVRLDSENELPTEKNIKTVPEGVYYSTSFVDSGYFTAAIAGPCPNLGQEGECTIYSQRPMHCRKFGMGTIDCDKTRARDGLKPIQELIQLTPRQTT